MVGENSLSGGERSIRIFSLALPLLQPLLSLLCRGGASDQKAESRFKATGAPPERPPQSASELQSYLGLFTYLWEKGRLDEVWGDFARRGQALKTQPLGPLGWIVLLLSSRQVRRSNQSAASLLALFLSMTSNPCCWKCRMCMSCWLHNGLENVGLEQQQMDAAFCNVL